MIRIACATNDGTHFTKEHFGEADRYLLYRYDETSRKFVFEKELVNPHFEEQEHGDPKKANFVSSLLKPEKINVIMNRAIGKNIVRMRKNFTVVVSHTDKIVEALKMLDPKVLQIENEKPAGTDREVIHVKNDS